MYHKGYVFSIPYEVHNTLLGTIKMYPYRYVVPSRVIFIFTLCGMMFFFCEFIWIVINKRYIFADVEWKLH